MPPSSTLLKNALALHQQGKLADAEAAYRNILNAEPDHPEALHGLGAIAYQQQKYVEAERLIHRALAVRPDHLDALNNHGLTLFALGRMEEALASFTRALAVKPEFAAALHNRANVLYAQRRLADALASYDRALAVQPNYFEALVNRGHVLFELGRPQEALASYDQAVALRPDLAQVWYSRGNALVGLNRWGEALTSYDRALVNQPSHLEALSNRSNVLFELARFDEALAACDRALAIKPNFAAALCNRARILLKLNRAAEAETACDRAVANAPDFAEAHYNRGSARLARARFEDALASFDRAVALRPDFVEALYNRGNALAALDQRDSALAAFDRTLVVKPDHAGALNNRGNILQDLRCLDDAVASYDAALAVKPDFAEAQWNQSLCRLLGGDFSRGFAQYEWRWHNKPQMESRRDFAQALWLGDEDIAGKTILLHAEGGYGDTLHFCRYAALVAARGARVVLEVQPALKRLLTRLAGVTQVIAAGEPLPAFDVHCPLMSLPLAFHTALTTIPAAVPYVTPAPDALARWQAKLSALPRPRIGLTWSGNADHRFDRFRSIAPAHLTPLLTGRGSRISLKREYRAEDATWLSAHPEVHDFSANLDDFEDTAALTSLLDLVISVDTSIAHLAGALGRPVWIPLPERGLDWRWMLARADSPWYPTARLYRQTATGTWDPVIARVADDLRTLTTS